MCGRFDQAQSNREIDALIARLPPDSPPLKRGEIFPTNNALALVCPEGLPAPASLAWGFPRRDGKGVLINARAESPLQKPMFKKALLTRPVAIPTTGFYEWQTAAGQKQKFLLTDPGQSTLWLAGFWNEFAHEEKPRRFTILTTKANPSVRALHDRMPVLLAPDELEAWLLGNNLAEILAREPFALAARPV